jgi:hypothetical protein
MIRGLPKLRGMGYFSVPSWRSLVVREVGRLKIRRDSRRSLMHNIVAPPPAETAQRRAC